MELGKPLWASAWEGGKKNRHVCVRTEEDEEQMGRLGLASSQREEEESRLGKAVEVWEE